MEKQYVTRRNTGGRPSKLSDETINDVVCDYNDGETQVELAKKYQVSRSTIQRVLKDRRLPDNE
jgi:Mor family transcriptional regulator